MHLSAAVAIAAFTCLALSVPPLKAQAPACPADTSLASLAADAQAIVLGRVASVSFDRDRPESGRPYLSSHRTALEYRPVKEYRPRGDKSTDLYASLPEAPGGISWSTGTLYLFFLREGASGYGSRRIYWVEACYGTRLVHSAHDADTLLRRIGKL